MRCSVCGADNLEGAVYCEDCGARLPSAAAAAPAPAPVTPAPAPAPAPAPTPAPAPESEPAAVIPPVPSPAESAPAPAPSSLNCASCGAQNLPNVAFCEDCGASLTAAGAATPAPPTPVSYDAGPASTPTPTPSPAARARLILSGGREFNLEKDVILIGRRSPVDGIFPEVDLTDYDTESYISRRHGKLTLSETGIIYEDLGSSNGSFLNGTRLQGGVQQSVRDGDSLRLGKTEMVLRCS